MINLFLKGGFMMWPILIGSLIGLSIIIDRVIYLRNKRRENLFLLTELNKIKGEKNIKKVKEVISERNCPISRILKAGIENINRPIEEKSPIVERAGSGQVVDMEKNLSMLGLIGHIEPLMGLLGTVSGMIKCFMTIQRTGGQVEPVMLAGGIWEALITTAAGLTVAIPIIFAHHLLELKVDNITSDMKDTVAHYPEVFGKSKIENLEIEETEGNHAI